MKDDYHHRYIGPETHPAHYPLFDHDLDHLLSRYPHEDFYGRRSIERRVQQAVPGMKASLFAASADTQARAGRAVQLFQALSEAGDAPASTPLRQQLCAFLDITQPELHFAHQPLDAA